MSPVFRDLRVFLLILALAMTACGPSAPTSPEQVVTSVKETLQAEAKATSAVQTAVAKALQQTATTQSTAELTLDQLNGCSIDSDCALVPKHACGDVAAVNKSHVQLWNAYLDHIKKLNAGRVVCAPSLPMDQFKPLCMVGKCAAIDVRCDVPIEDPKAYEHQILSSPIVLDLQAEIGLPRIALTGDCLQAARVSAFLEFDLPTSFSSLGVSYTDRLLVSWSKDGSIELPTHMPNQPRDLTGETLRAYFRDKIQQLEDNPRVQEFIAKTGVSHGLLYNTPIRLQTDAGHLLYDLSTGQVGQYLLANSVEWDEFPEIGQTHQIIEQHLAQANPKSCRIGRQDIHSYTYREFHEQDTGAWYMTTALICGNGWAEARFRLYPDGSYDRYESP